MFNRGYILRCRGGFWEGPSYMFKREGSFWKGEFDSGRVFKKEGECILGGMEGWVDFGRVEYRCLKERYNMGKRGRFCESCKYMLYM